MRWYCVKITFVLLTASVVGCGMPCNRLKKRRKGWVWYVENERLVVKSSAHCYHYTLMCSTVSYFTRLITMQCFFIFISSTIPLDWLMLSILWSLLCEIREEFFACLAVVWRKVTTFATIFGGGDDNDEFVSEYVVFTKFWSIWCVCAESKYVYCINRNVTTHMIKCSVHRQSLNMSCQNHMLFVSIPAVKPQICLTWENCCQQP